MTDPGRMAIDSSTQTQRKSLAAQKAGGIELGMRVLSYLIGGMVFYGGIGWLIGRWTHMSFWMPLGIIVGAGLATFLIIKRFGGIGSNDPPSATTTHPTAGEEDQ